MAAFGDRIAFAYGLVEGLNYRAVRAMAEEAARLTPAGALALAGSRGCGASFQQFSVLPGCIPVGLAVLRP